MKTNNRDALLEKEREGEKGKREKKHLCAVIKWKSMWSEKYSSDVETNQSQRERERGREGETSRERGRFEGRVGHGRWEQEHTVSVYSTERIYELWKLSSSPRIAA